MSEPTESQFVPPRHLRNRHLQSLLASLHPRRTVVLRSTEPLRRVSRELLLDCGAGVRLQGFHAPVEDGEQRGLVVLFHGWEGSHASTYLLSAAHHLRQAGYETFRLNFRDHGETHHLNEGLFHSCLIDEVVGAVAAVARQFPARPLSLVGFSLGGNFALRVALRAPAHGIPLERFVSVNPAIDPAHVLEALERGPSVYRDFFMRKWRRSLLRKQALFPRTYDLAECLRRPDLRETTRFLIERYSEMGTLERYLDGYSIAGDRLAGLRVPGTILMAEDDPIIPIADVRSLGVPPAVAVEVHRFGGHCGYVERLFGPSWIDRRILAALGDGGGGRDTLGGP